MNNCLFVCLFVYLLCFAVRNEILVALLDQEILFIDLTKPE